MATSTISGAGTTGTNVANEMASAVWIARNRVLAMIADGVKPERTALNAFTCRMPLAVSG